MQIDDTHWLTGARRELILGGGAMNVRRFLVIHFTSGASALSSINYWRQINNGVCAHFVIDRDGTIFQCRPCNKTCGHAGESAWRDPGTGVLYKGLNACAIGIELANAGDNEALAERWSPLPRAARLVTARHKHGGPLTKWEAYPPEQIDACRELSLALVRRYHLDDIAGHDDIAPRRKNDPGPAFPMTALREYCGFTAPLPKLST